MLLKLDTRKRKKGKRERGNRPSKPRQLALDRDVGGEERKREGEDRTDSRSASLWPQGKLGEKKEKRRERTSRICISYADDRREDAREGKGKRGHSWW